MKNNKIKISKGLFVVIIIITAMIFFVFGARVAMKIGHRQGYNSALESENICECEECMPCAEIFNCPTPKDCAEEVREMKNELERIKEALR